MSRYWDDALRTQAVLIALGHERTCDRLASQMRPQRHSAAHLAYRDAPATIGLC